MKKFLSVVTSVMASVVFCGIAFAQPKTADQAPGEGATADSGLAMAKAKNCMSCHAVDKKVLGPSYKQIAEKYREKDGSVKAETVDKLAVKVIKGTAGAWGPVPMSANPQVNEAEAKRLVNWVMSQK